MFEDVPDVKYHPWITRYCEVMNNYYDGENFRWDEENVLRQVKAALHDHKEIMEITWRRMYDVLGGVMSFSTVYSYGWDRDEGTRVLRKKFEEMAYPKVLDKSLEDYL
jgi:hypothetical protein